MPKAAINFQGAYTAQSLIEYLGGRALQTAVAWKLTPKVPVRAPRPVTWQNVVGVTAVTGALHCAFTGVDNFASGASSVETFTDEGRVRFRRGSPTAKLFCGLSAGDSNQNFLEIGFAWHLTGGLARVYEGGALKATFTQPPETAVYEVVRLWSYVLNRYEIHYLIDGLAKYTSAATPAATLRVDTSFSPQVASSLVDVELTQPVTALGATSHSSDLELPGHPGVVFKKSLGGSPTAIDTETGYQSAGLDVESIFDDESISEESVEAGTWKRAKFEIYTIVPADLALGQLVEFSGRIGNVETEGPTYKAEARPLTSVAQGNVGQLAVARCNVVHFADASLENRCKLSRASTAHDGFPITVTGTVTNGASSTQFIDSSRTEPVDHFTMGEVTFTSGPLSGRTYEVGDYDSTTKTFTLRRAAHVRIGTGWTYSAVRGCRRTAADCINKYNNIINHRGERFITNIEQIHQIERAR